MIAKRNLLQLGPSCHWRFHSKARLLRQEWDPWRHHHQLLINPLSRLPDRNPVRADCPSLHRPQPQASRFFPCDPE